MIDTVALKSALIALGAAVGAATWLAQTATASGDSDTVIVISGGVVLTSALGLLVQLGRMWARGDIVSRASHDETQKLRDALDQSARSIDAFSETVIRIDQSSQAREQAMERIINAYLPDRGA